MFQDSDFSTCTDDTTPSPFAIPNEEEKTSMKSQWKKPQFKVQSQSSTSETGNEAKVSTQAIPTA